MESEFKVRDVVAEIGSGRRYVVVGNTREERYDLQEVDRDGNDLKCYFSPRKKRVEQNYVKVDVWRGKLPRGYHTHEVELELPVECIMVDFTVDFDK